MMPDILDSRPSYLQNLKSVYKMGDFGPTSSEREETWGRLLENKIFKDEQRSIQKTLLDQIEIKRNCPFKPQISAKSVQLAKRRNSTDKGNEKKPIYERLYALKKNKKSEVIEEVEEFVEARPKKLYSESNTSQSHTSFLDRSANYAKGNQILKEKLKRNVEINDEKQFHPKISEMSQKLAENRNLDYLNVIDRLQADLYKRQKQKEIFTLIKDEIAQEGCTFKPEIPISNRQTDFPNSDEDFYLRQEEFELHKKIKSQILQKKIQSENSFQPKINSVSEILADGNESLVDRTNRLYNQSKIQSAYINKMSETIQNQFNFTPLLNENSMFIARHRKNQYIETPKKPKYEPLDTECSFKPTSFTSTSSMAYSNAASKIKNFDPEEVAHQKRIRQLLAEENQKKFEEIKLGK